MIKKLLFTMMFVLSAISTNAQTENPRGIYKLAGIWGKNGQYFKEPFDQYKICADNVTLMMTVNGKLYRIGKNDQIVFNYTGPEPKSPDDKSSLIYDSDDKEFKLKWWSNYPNHQIFPADDWCIEYYKSTGIPKEEKIIVEALQSKTVLENKKDLKGRWRLIGLMDELRGVKKETRKMRDEYPNSRYYNRNFVVFGDKYMFETLNFGQGYYEEIEYIGNKGYKIIKDRFHDEKNETQLIKWISEDLIAVEFKDDYRTDYRILERITDEKSILDYILERYK